MGAQGRDEKHLEFKVGAMILVALIILISFVLILGDWSLADRRKFNVYFQNPGGLSAGVAVKAAGRKIGTVTEMTFLGQDGPKHPVTGRPTLVRVQVEVDADVFTSIRNDVRFYITTKGVLGDPFLEVDPGVGAQPLDITKPIFGTDPPRLDLFLADAAELVKGLNRLLVTNADNLDQLISGSANLVTAVDNLLASDAGVQDGKARIGRILQNVEELTVDVRVLVQDAKEKYVDDPSISRSIKNMESISNKINRDIGPLIKDVRETLLVLNRLGDTIGPEEQKSIKEALLKLDDIANRADSTLGKVDTMVTRMKNGKGTVGQLLQDEEIYDDLKELLRDIKQHPWKLIWED